MIKRIERMPAASPDSSAPPPELDAFGRRLAGRLGQEADGSVIGVYLHGSGAMGDWRAASDVDVLVVVADAPNGGAAPLIEAPGDAATIVEALVDAARDCPGAGLEASVVRAAAAAHPLAPYPFLVHVAGSGAGSIRVVDGTARAGDDDLALHYLVCRARGTAWAGPPPSEVFGPLDRATALRMMAEELRWGLENAGADYALLNTCRAVAYLRSGAVLSKEEGGRWAIARRVGQAASIRAALDARSGSPSAPVPRETAFIEEAISALRAGR